MPPKDHGMDTVKSCPICRFNNEIQLKILHLVEESKKQEAIEAIISALGAVYLKYNSPESLEYLECLVLSALGPKTYSEEPALGQTYRCGPN